MNGILHCTEFLSASYKMMYVPSQADYSSDPMVSLGQCLNHIVDTTLPYARRIPSVVGFCAGFLMCATLPFTYRYVSGAQVC